MSTTGRQSGHPASWHNPTRQETERESETDKNATKLCEENSDRLLETYELECEQLRTLFTRENDRLRKKLAAANKQLSTSFDVVQILATQVSRLVRNTGQPDDKATLDESFSAWFQQTAVEEGTLFVTQ